MISGSSSFRERARRWVLRTGRILSGTEGDDLAELENRVGGSLLRSLVTLLFARRFDRIDGGEIDASPLQKLGTGDGSRIPTLRRAMEQLRDSTDSELFEPNELLPRPFASESGRALLRDIESALEQCTEGDRLGEMHTELSQVRFERRNGELHLENTDDRRQSGQFYTPPALVDYVVRRALESSVGDRTDDRARAIRVVDPAAGTGAFLCRTLEWLAEHGREHGAFDSETAMFRHLLSRQIYGTDRDRRALELARWNLRLAALDLAEQPISTAALARAGRLEAGDSLVFATRPELVSTDGASDFDEALTELHGLPPETADPLHWHDVFPKVFNEGGFYAVVGNPPWVSFGLRDTESLDEPLKRYLRGRFTGSAQYKLPLYPLFMELGLRLARRDGVVSLVVPDSFLTGSRFSNIRETLVDRARLEELSVLEEGIWSDGTSGRTVVYRARPGAPGSRNRVEMRRVSTPDRLDASDCPTFDRQSALGRGPHRRFDVVVDGDERDFVERMREAEATLGEFVELYSGCIGRYGQDSIRSDSRHGSWTIRDRSDSVVLQDDDARDHWRRLIPSGRFLSAFELFQPDAWLYFHPDPEVRRSYAKSGFDPRRHEQPKLLLRQTGDALTAAFEPGETYCLNNIHVINAPSADTLHFAAGLLNSDVLRTFHRIVSLEGGRTLAQVDIDAIRQLPVPTGMETASDRLGRLSRRAAELGSTLTAADRRFADLLASSAETRHLTLGVLRARDERLTIERRCPEDLQGRLTGLELTADDERPLLTGIVDDARRPIASFDARSRALRNLVWLALRELLRRRWRKRLWAKGTVFEALLDSIEVRLPAAPPDSLLDFDFGETATELERRRSDIDATVRRLYGVPTVPAR